MASKPFWKRFLEPRGGASSSDLADSTTSLESLDNDIFDVDKRLVDAKVRRKRRRILIIVLIVAALVAIAGGVAAGVVLGIRSSGDSDQAVIDAPFIVRSTGVWAVHLDRWLTE
jgi:hypothetical protein